jgi:hypothetical protein
LNHRDGFASDCPTASRPFLSAYCGSGIFPPFPAVILALRPSLLGHLAPLGPFGPLWVSISCGHGAIGASPSIQEFKGSSHHPWGCTTAKADAGELHSALVACNLNSMRQRMPAGSLSAGLAVSGARRKGRSLHRARDRQLSQGPYGSRRSVVQEIRARRYPRRSVRRCRGQEHFDAQGVHFGKRHAGTVASARPLRGGTRYRSVSSQGLRASATGFACLPLLLPSQFALPPDSALRYPAKG